METINIEEAQHQYENIEVKLIRGWYLSSMGIGIKSFEIHHYAHFLDSTESFEELATGLNDLSPFADDALEIVGDFDLANFDHFKSEVRMDRSMNVWDESTFPEEWSRILMPARFIVADSLALKTGRSLGSALILQLYYDATGVSTQQNVLPRL